MNRRQRLGGTVAPEDRFDEHADPAVVDSTFDTGQELLHAALEEVRAPSHDRAPLADDPWETISARRHGRRRLRTTAPIEPETPTTEDPSGPGAELDSEPRARQRSRRPSSDVAAPSIEALDSEPRRRPRRPPKGQDATRARTALVVDAPSEELEALPRAMTTASQTAERRPQAARTAAQSSVSRPRRGRLVGLVAVLAVVAIGVATFVTLSSNGGSDGPTRSVGPPASHARLTFASVTTPEGASVARVWELRGKKGTRFVGTLTFTNTTSAPISASHIETIPKSLASSVADITFDRQPVVVQADPVVQYFVPVAEGEVVTAHYEIQVAPGGAHRDRLEAWAQDLETTTTSTTVPTTTATTAAASSGSTSSGSSSGKGGTVHPTPATAAPAPPPPPPATGTIIIRTISIGGTGTFNYSGSGGSSSVTTSGSPDGSGQAGARTVAAGQYSWTQAQTAGWRISGIDCTDRDAGPFDQRSTVSGATATFNVQPGETVVCTWTNRL